MPGPGSILKELHRLRRHAKDLQGEIERGPLKIKAQEAKAGKQQESVREAQEALKKHKVETHEKEVTLKATQAKIAKHEKQLEASSGKKEYDALKKEIAEEKAACSKLEDEILQGMEQAELMAARIPEMERNSQKAKEESARLLEDIQTRRHAFMEQLKAVNQQLSEVEATLPDDARSQYLRLLGARGEDALSSVVGRSCTACYTDVTTQNYHDLLQGMFFVCKSCGRMLYLGE